MALVLGWLGLTCKNNAVLRMSLVLGILIARADAATHVFVARYVDNEARVLEMQTATVSGGADSVKRAEHAVRMLSAHIVAVPVVVVAIALVNTLAVQTIVAGPVPHLRTDLDIDAAAVTLDVRTEAGGVLAHSVGCVLEVEAVAAAVRCDNPVHKSLCLPLVGHG
jgi:hypothetical protein